MRLVKTLILCVNLIALIYVVTRFDKIVDLCVPAVRILKAIGT